MSLFNLTPVFSAKIGHWHPNPRPPPHSLIHAIISVIERFVWEYLQAAVIPRWLRRGSLWRPCCAHQRSRCRPRANTTPSIDEQWAYIALLVVSRKLALLFLKVCYAWRKRGISYREALTRRSGDMKYIADCNTFDSPFCYIAAPRGLCA